jgi:hypothetical protein
VTRVLAEYVATPQGEKSAVLRREGLHQSQVAEWAAARDAMAAGQEYSRQTHRASANTAKKSTEADRLRRETTV